MFSWFSESRLFGLAREAQRLPHVVLVIVLAFVFVLVSQMGAVPVVVTMGLLYGFSESGIDMSGQSVLISGVWFALTLIGAFGLVFGLLWLWLKFFEKRRFASLGYERAGALMQYGRGFAIGALMFAGSVGLMALFGDVAVEQGDTAQQGWFALGGVLVVLLGWVVQGAAEEALTRGWVLPVLGARYRPWVGLAVSSLIFAVLHGLNPNMSWLALLNLALFGVFAGLYAMREGSLWGISALHSVWNWVQGNVFGLQVSGSDTGGGMLLNLMETGPDWFTGGAFGPEGGLAVTLMLALGIALVLFWGRKN